MIEHIIFISNIERNIYLGNGYYLHFQSFGSQLEIIGILRPTNI